MQEFMVSVEGSTRVPNYGTDLDSGLCSCIPCPMLLFAPKLTRLKANRTQVSVIPPVDYLICRSTTVLCELVAHSHILEMTCGNLKSFWPPVQQIVAWIQRTIHLIPHAQGDRDLCFLSTTTSVPYVSRQLFRDSKQFAIWQVGEGEW